MKRWMLWLTCLLSLKAFGQYVAGGVYGGSQPCSYPTAAAPGMTDESDEVAELRKTLTALKKKLSRAQTTARKAKKEVSDLDRQIGAVLTSSAKTIVIDHMRNSENAPAENCNPTGNATSDAAAPGTLNTWGGQSVSSGEHHSGNGNNPFEHIYTRADGQIKCNEANHWLLDGGTVDAGVCHAHDPENRPILAIAKKSSDTADCESAIGSYQESYQNYLNAQADVKDLQQQVKDLNKQIDAQKDQDDEETEGCAACKAARAVRPAGPSLAQTVIGAGLIGALGYMDYRNIQTQTQTYAQLGYPSSPYAGYQTLVGSYPLFNAALGLTGVGAGGYGSGGYACAGTIGNGGGPYGFLGSPYGNGAYNPSGSPFGYPSSYAPYPQYGGALSYFPQYGMGANGAGYGGPVPVPGYGLQIAGYPGGYTAGGYPGAYPGSIAPYPYGSAAGANPYTSQILAQGYSQIAQLQAQIGAISAQMQAYGGYGGGYGYTAGTSIAPYPTSYAPYTTSYGLATSTSLSGPVPVPGTTGTGIYNSTILGR